MVKRIVLCADDYGYAAPISQGIIDLIQRGRITATSCLVNLPDWSTACLPLKHLAVPLAVGLHLNLTEGECLSNAFKKTYGAALPSLATVLARSLSHRWHLSPLLAECAAQIDRFSQEMGRLPDFIDGHQHVHQLPQVRTVLEQLTSSWPRPCYFRVINPIWSWQDCFNIKQLVIYFSGTRTFTQLLKATGQPHNASFAGIYNFTTSSAYAKQFPRFLSQVTDGGLIMCHPAATQLDDTAISKARVDEYSYFASSQFLDDCAAADVELTLPKF